jgi:hypothetical protein
MSAQSFFEQTRFTCRPATHDDFDNLYDIWMQDHILPFMSFEKMSREAFKPIFDTLMQISKIYVLLDKETIIATRRIVFGEGKEKHTVYFCSFGVHEKHQGKGAGTFFYDFFIDLLKTKYPYINRIVLTQEPDNPSKAKELALKKGFNAFATLPDWHIRETGPYQEKWYVGEIFFEKLLTPLTSTPIKTPSLTLPPLQETNALFSMQKKEGQGGYTLFFDKKPCCSIQIDKGVRRFGHIHFLTIQPSDIAINKALLSGAIRFFVANNPLGAKKCEVSTHLPIIIEALADAGFFQRGQSRASACIDDVYFDEYIADFSLFNLKDAITLINKEMMLTNDEKETIIQSISALQPILSAKQTSKPLSDFGYIYLQNLGYQVIKSIFGEKLHTSTEQLISLIDALPYNDIKDAMMHLVPAQKDVKLTC